MKRKNGGLPADPLWFKDAVIYELHVRAFQDSDGDGVGDFAGLVRRLDYLADLGVTAVWLLPFYPSPLRDDGYDIADYYGVHPRYGTMGDFRAFLREAHRRNLRVITELIVNHTSDQHPWFQRARRSPPGSRWRNFYVWSDTPERYRGTRIIFQDYETSNWAWDPVAGAYYWHRFYSHQPDLNFDHPATRREMFRVMDYWFGMGVDGMRLDAVPYLYEREGTSCENLPETHAFLKELRRHLDAKYPGRMLLAEANQWPEDAAAYFGEGDECHMNFHFPLMPRLFMSIYMEDRHPVVDILEQTPPIPDNAQWALFLRNHDELTLEMVTDEERDYMYRVYAHERQARLNLGIRRRLAPLLSNNRRRIELVNALLFSLPGTPVIYYGDEIGMGDNIYLGDRNGVRTPMQWSADRNAGFSDANPQKLYLPVIVDPEYHYEAVNVEAQQGNPGSLLRWMKRLIALRKRYPALSRGGLEFVNPDNRKVLAFVRSHGGVKVLVVANLSRFVQFAHLDLGRWRGSAPVEVFGGTRFPAVGAEPYMLTLGPHSFYWFEMEAPAPVRVQAGVPELEVEGDWRGAAEGEAKERVAAALLEHIQRRRWFRGKGFRPLRAELAAWVEVPGGERGAAVALVRVHYADRTPEVCLMPLGYARRAGDREAVEGRPESVVVRLKVRGGERGERGVLYDASADPEFAGALLGLMEHSGRWRGWGGEVVGQRTPALSRALSGGEVPPAREVSGEQSNTSVAFGDRVILKLYRHLDAGTNPDLELGLYLSENQRFAHTPAVCGWLEFRGGGGESWALGVARRFIPNVGDAWGLAVDEAVRFVERGEPNGRRLPRRDVVSLALEGLSPGVAETLGGFAEAARLMGQRTAELHLALAAGEPGGEFSPVEFNPFHRRALYQSLRNLTGATMELVESSLGRLPAGLRRRARGLLAREDEILRRFHVLVERAIPAVRIRTHGDLHLGQFLSTGRDFYILDFEGEPMRSLEERRLKRSPLRDVAGMLRSFDYAAQAAERKTEAVGSGRRVKPEIRRRLRFWRAGMAAVYLRQYLEAVRPSPLLDRLTDEDLRLLLHVYILEKAIYELNYELNNRPDWVGIPLAGVEEALEGLGR